MTLRRILAAGALVIGAPLALLQAPTAQTPQAAAQNPPGAVQQAPPAASAAAPPPQAPRQTPPRGRSVTLGDVTGAEMKDNVFTVSAGPDLVRVQFYRDDIFRIWLGPDGTFTEAQPNPDDAQIVVFKGPAVPVAWRDVGEYYRLDSKMCVLRVYKKPLRFALFDKDNVSVVWQESRAITYGPTTTQTLRRGETEEAERLLGMMDEVYSLLGTLDYPDALTGGLRRTTDMVRGVTERTRGDLTLSLRLGATERAAAALEKALQKKP